MFVERDDLVVGYLVQRFGAVTLAMSTRMHCFGEVDEAEIEAPKAPRSQGPRRNLHAVPPRNVILGSEDAEAGSPRA
jgi:hypothetical protein